MISQELAQKTRKKGLSKGSVLLAMGPSREADRNDIICANFLTQVAVNWDTDGKRKGNGATSLFIRENSFLLG